MTKPLTAHTLDAFHPSPDLSIDCVQAGRTYVIGNGLDEIVCVIEFQDGPVKDKGVNGVTTEALLAICKDRLETFQQGAYACKRNGDAITAIHDALYALHDRTRERRARNVEGTMGL